MTVTIKGWEKWDKWISGVGDSTTKKVAEECLRVGYKIERRAKSIAPVDTARLRNSINTTGQGKGKLFQVMIGTDVFYAPFVEFGTIKTPKQPFLINSFYKEITGLEKSLNSIINKELD